MVVRSPISSLVLKEKTHIEYWEFFVIEYLIRHTLACRKLCTVTNLLIKEKTMVITLNGNCQCYQLYLFLMPQKIVKNLMFAFAFELFSHFNIILIFFFIFQVGVGARATNSGGCRRPPYTIVVGISSFGVWVN